MPSPAVSATVTAATHRRGKCLGKRRRICRLDAAVSAVTSASARAVTIPAARAAERCKCRLCAAVSAVTRVMGQLELFEPAFYISRLCQVRSSPALGWLCLEIENEPTPIDTAVHRPW